MDSKNLKVLFVFALVYVALYLLSIITPLAEWSLTFDLGKLDYTLFLLPVAGFFMVYLLVPWMRGYLGAGKTFIYSLPVLLLAGGFLAFYVAVFYFFANQAALQGLDISDFPIDYLDFFIKSSFIYFLLGGIGGWGARILIENFEEESASK